MQNISVEFEAGPIAFDRIGSGPPILFIHGLTYDRQMWLPVMQRLADEYTCIAVDLPGHGKSPSAQSYDLETVTDRIYDVVRGLGVQEPVVVGHALGALNAVAYAARFPVAALLTSDQTLPSIALLSRLHDPRDPAQRPALSAIWRSIVRQIGVGLTPRSQRAFVESAANPGQDVVNGYWREALETSPAEFEARFIDYLSFIDAPFSAVFDAGVEPEYLQWLRAIMPACNVVLLPNCGHFPHLNAIDSFIAEVRAVLRRRRAAE